MATGDQGDIHSRLRALVPNNWFPFGPLPVLDTIFSGAASALASGYSLIQYVRAQMRLATSTGGMLDIAAYDFFGSSLLRRTGETDAQFIARIQKSLFAPANTREAIIEVLTNLTGTAPKIFEPRRPADTGGLLTTPGSGPRVGTLGWGIAGGWGSPKYPYQIWVTAYRPKGMGVPNLQGWGTPGHNPIGLGGWGTRLLAWVGFASAEGIVTDADIYAAVAAVMSAGTVAWVNIQDAS